MLACAWLEAGVIGVVGWDDAVGGVGGDGPVLAGFQVVVVVAEALAFVDAGVVGVDEVLDVVGFDACHGGATAHFASW